MVPNVPFNLSQAIQEFGGSGPASDTLNRAKLGTTGLLSRLAGTVKFVLPSIITTSANPYFYFSYNGTYTIFNHNDGGVQQNYQLIKGQVWVRIDTPTSTANFENCSQGQWFLADGTLRGLRKYQQGVAASQLYFSWSNGGQVIQSPVMALNWP